MIVESPEFWIDRSGRSVGIFSKGLPRQVNWQMVAELKEMALEHTEKNVRLCLHDGPDALFHTMIIVEKMGKYYRPHKHLDKGECFHILEGSMAVFSFDDEGSVIDQFVLNPDDTFMYRVAENMYHAVIPLTPLVVYHESKIGPFLQEGDSIFAPWAPVGKDQVENDEYYQTLLGQIP